MKSHLMYLLLAVLPASTFAQDPDVARRLDSLFGQPGYLNGGLLVSGPDGIIYRKSFGYADNLIRTPLTADDGFQTASVSKPFTAIAVLQLVERGKVHLSDCFQHYFPAFPYPTITLLQLLSHTSGMPDAAAYDSLINRQPAVVIHNSDLLVALQGHYPLHFTPGTTFEYCNTGYQLLALLVEQVSHVSFAQYLKTYIFKPSGLRHTWVRTNEDATPVKNHTMWPMYDTLARNVDSFPMSGNDRFLTNLYYDNHTMGGTYGDQNIVTTTEDLYMFAQALISGKLISRRLLQQAISPTVLTGGKPYSEHNPALGTGESSYGLGWEIHIDNGDTIIGHSGYNRGIYVQLYINLSQQQVIVLFDNMEGADFLQKFLNAVRVLAGKAAQPVDIRLSAARYFGNALLKGDPEAALLLFNDLRLDSSRYHFTPQQMNQLGYDFLHTGFLAESLATFRINLLLYPNDFNRYDSYADALVAAGKKGDAILFYRKALALKPDAAGTRKKLEKLGGVPPSNQK